MLAEGAWLPVATDVAVSPRAPASVRSTSLESQLAVYVGTSQFDSLENSSCKRQMTRFATFKLLHVIAERREVNENQCPLFNAPSIENGVSATNSVPASSSLFESPDGDGRNGFGRCF